MGYCQCKQGKKWTIIDKYYSVEIYKKAGKPKDLSKPLDFVTEKGYNIFYIAIDRVSIIHRGLKTSDQRCDALAHNVGRLMYLLATV
jgi:hypothetical protein